MDILRELVLPKLEGVRKSGGSFTALCPAHEDSTPSLSLAPGKEHPVVFTCHAGCDRDSILAAIGLTWNDLCTPRDSKPRDEAWTKYGPAEVVYPYYDENGTLLFQVLRAPGKKFVQRRPDPAAKSGWTYRLGETRRVLFHLPQLLENLADGSEVWIAEGEKDVLALERHGCTATCNPGGAGKWREEYSEFFRDAIVHIVADRDEPGQRHARQVLASLKGIAAAVEIVEAAGEGLPDGRKIKDAADHFAAGYSVADFVVTTQDDDAPVDLAPDLHEFLSVDDPPYDWLIPKILERGDRLIWTGGEGHGKSVTVRMLCIAAAAGLHPFERATVKPCKVLFIDLENSERKTRKHFRTLEKITRLKNRRVPDGNLRIICRPEGINVLSEDGAAWLLERVTAHKPDLLYIGSFYRMHQTDMNDERAARGVTVVLDQARARCGCAVITEAHSPHGDGGARAVRPIGSSLLMRWPELGFGIRGAADSPRSESGHYMKVDVVMWRGPRDDEYRWPQQMAWGDTENGEWPWVPSSDGGRRHLTVVDDAS